MKDFRIAVVEDEGAYCSVRRPHSTNDAKISQELRSSRKGEKAELEAAAKEAARSRGTRSEIEKYKISVLGAPTP